MTAGFISATQTIKRFRPPPQQQQQQQQQQRLQQQEGGAGGGEGAFSVNNLARTVHEENGEPWACLGMLSGGEACVLFFAGAVARQSKERLPSLEMFGTMAGEENARPGRHFKTWHKVGSLLTGRFFFAFRGIFPDFRGGVRVSRNCFNPGKNPEKTNSCIAEKSRIVAEHLVGAPCEPCAPCHHPALHRI